MKERIYKIFGALLGVIISALGFSSCDDKEEPCMYGTPYAEFELKGQVTDSQDKPVEDAEVSVEQKYTIGDNAGDFLPLQCVGSDGKAGDSVKTDSQGYYSLKASPMTDVVRVTCTAPTSSTLQSESVEIQLVLVKNPDIKDNFYLGSYSTTQNFKLK